MAIKIPLTLSPKQAADEKLYTTVAARMAGVAPDRVALARVVKRSIDARRGAVKVHLTVELFTDDEPQPGPVNFRYEDVSGRETVVVVGAGPAGLFAALRLIELGLRPVILERGRRIADRKKDIASINRNLSIDPESNYAFGEGGAGTFSDGKLYTRSKKRGDYHKALSVLVRHGASPGILSDAHPHIGTDKLPGVITAIRRTIEQCGGQVIFSARMTGIGIKDGAVKSVTYTLRGEDGANSAEEGRAVAGSGYLAAEEVGRSEKGNHAAEKEGCRSENGSRSEKDSAVRPENYTGTSCTIDTRAVILATGHSARDVYRMLHRLGVRLEAKNFAMGVRIEHPQGLIDSIQYRMPERGEYLPAASYSLVEQVYGRGVYSFCMCPGGFIVPAMTDAAESVVNGMSPSERNSRWANSGIVTEIRQDDLAPLADEFGVMAGLEFQKRLEQAARKAGGEPFRAPAQRVSDFVSGRPSSSLPLTSYVPGLTASRLDEWMPGFISSSLRQGISTFGRRMRGFVTGEALVAGVESRTSTPVRIPRDPASLMHPEVKGLLPAGEGAGYAGGIISAALDGERCADALAEYLK